jgi:hypothetical protein
VITYYTTEKTVELITTKGIYSITEQEIDNSLALVSAIEQGKIVFFIQKTIHQQLSLSETRVSDLGKYLQGLITPSTMPEIAFRITILSSVYSLSTVELFLCHKSLHIDLYNYL